MTEALIEALTSEARERGGEREREGGRESISNSVNFSIIWYALT